MEVNGLWLFVALLVGVVIGYTGMAGRPQPDRPALAQRLREAEAAVGAWEAVWNKVRPVPRYKLEEYQRLVERLRRLRAEAEHARMSTGEE